MNPHEAFEPEKPTEEELEALLGDDSFLDAGDIYAEPVRRALLVVRRDVDLRLLTSVLATERIEISMARNPFTGLDYLRARDFDWIFTEFSLWAASGDLLFRRIAELDRPVEVIFLCQGGAEGETSPEIERASRTRARAWLEEPLQDEALRILVRQLVRELGDREGPARSLTAKESMLGVDEPQGRGAGELSPQAAGVPAQPVESGDDLPGWYRFFFEVRRGLRARPSLEARLEDVSLALARVAPVAHLAVALRRVGEDRRGVDLRIISHSTGSGGEVELHRRLVDHLGLLGAEAGAGPEGNSPGRSGDSGAWIFPLLLPGNRRALGIVTAESGEALPPLPVAIHEELTWLLVELIEAVETDR